MTTGCEALAEATRGCRLVLLAATDIEAEPLRAALSGDEQHAVATKTIYTGRLGGPGAAGLQVALAVSGCDKVNAALTLTSLLQAMSPAPELVLQVGIAGGFAAPGHSPQARPGDLVLATQEAYSDTGSSSPQGWTSARNLGLPMAQVDGVELGGVFPLDPALVAWAAGALGATDLSAGRRPGGGAGGRHGRAGGGAGEGPAVLVGPCVTSSTVTGTDGDARRIAERWGALAESMEGAAAAHVCALFRVPFLEVRGISNVVGDRDRAAWVVDRAVEVAGRAALALAAALAARTEA